MLTERKSTLNYLMMMKTHSCKTRLSNWIIVRDRSSKDRKISNGKVVTAPPINSPEQQLNAARLPKSARPTMRTTMTKTSHRWTSPASMTMMRKKRRSRTSTPKKRNRLTSVRPSAAARIANRAAELGRLSSLATIGSSRSNSRRTMSSIARNWIRRCRISTWSEV